MGKGTETSECLAYLGNEEFGVSGPSDRACAMMGVWLERMELKNDTRGFLWGAWQWG